MLSFTPPHSARKSEAKIPTFHTQVEARGFATTGICLLQAADTETRASVKYSSSQGDLPTSQRGK